MKDRPESESFRFWLIFMSILPGEFFIDVFSLSIVRIAQAKMLPVGYRRAI